MNGGLIRCECGQDQWVETVRDITYCIRCNKPHKVYPLPEPESEPEPEVEESLEGEQDGL